MKRIYKTYFHAAHHIEGHPRCGFTHGHTYHVEVVVDQKDWVDFHVIRTKVELVLSRYDHKDLGAMTCEELAERILEDLKRDAFPNAKSIRLRVFETPEFGVEVEWR